jgi:carbon storage regulator
MLILARKVGQSIEVDETTKVKIIEIRGDQVRIGFEAERTTPICRAELPEEAKRGIIETARNAA